MPKTKLEKLAIPPQEVRSRIVRSAAARIGFHSNKDIAEVLRLSESGLSNRLRGHSKWSVDDLAALCVRLSLTELEVRSFIKGRCM